MGNAIAKCVGGQTDYNGNGVPDNKEIQALIESYLSKQRDKKNKSMIKKILSAR